MTRILILTRHAKSAWDDPTLDDHDRPLNARGRAAAPRVGAWVARHVQPGEALISTARRAVETFDAMAPAFTSRPASSLVGRLYHAGPDSMAATLRQARAETVLMVGHNPGIGELAARLLHSPPADPAFRRYPTAATLIARFDIDNWADLQFGTGVALHFTIPRALDAPAEDGTR